MEDNLQYTKTTLPSQLTAVKDHAAKVSVEEQKQITTISTLEKDLDHALSEKKRLKEETDQKTMTKGEICSQILEKQRKISSMESESVNLSQSLELILQERDSISAKLESKRSYYDKTAERFKHALDLEKLALFCEMNPEGFLPKQKTETRSRLLVQEKASRGKEIDAELMRDNLIKENSKIKKSIENVKQKINEIKPELGSVDIKLLEEEYTALLSDESAKEKYLLSLQSQAEKLKGISDCDCGEENSVGLV